MLPRRPGIAEQLVASSQAPIRRRPCSRGVAHKRSRAPAVGRLRADRLHAPIIEPSKRTETHVMVLVRRMSRARKRACASDSAEFTGRACGNSCMKIRTSTGGMTCHLYGGRSK